LKKKINLQFNNYHYAKISNKGAQMPESQCKLVPYSEIAKRTQSISFKIGQPDIKTRGCDEVKNIDIKILEYSHSAGFESYRNKLSQFYTNQQAYL
jgi:aspartate aminotransferase